MTLVILNFETGCTDCPYWTIMATVEGNFDGEALSDSFDSYFESADTEDLEFEDMAEDVLNSMGWTWNFIDTKIPACDSAYTMWL